MRGPIVQQVVWLGVTASLPLLLFLSAFYFHLSVRHPRARGDPSYSKCCGLVLPLYCCYCCFCLHFTSISQFVILADAGTHRAASGVARCYRYVEVLLLVLLYAVVYCGKCVSKRGIRRMWMNGFPCARE
ncbi:hypothetical protein [Vibrio vulnificus]|uniref:hypothetical protein n=1 Tax=Vibrio vulnificus TaxID=672 RepID=UPI00209DF743|nr:hypothetical protein [Vibrio vulnificus]